MQPGGAAPAAPPPGMALGAGAALPAGASFASRDPDSAEAGLRFADEVIPLLAG